MIWKRFDCITDSRTYLSCTDECYYARDFIARGGFSASDDNKLISNFKKPSSRRGSSEWKYKTRAIEQFAQDLLTILGDGVVIAAIPTSKAQDDAEYDSRLEDAMQRVAKLNPSITVERPIERTRTVQALHQGGRRRIADVLQSLRWVGFSKSTDHVVLIDDIITCGSHFKACQQLIHQRHPEMSVIGVFWARTVWQQ